MTAAAATASTETLVDFIPRVSRHLEAPTHLAPYIDLLERAHRESIRVVVAAPPRHGKTESTLHALAWWLRQHPRGKFAYATYAQSIADGAAFNARTIAERCGLNVNGPLREWRMPAGGRVFWTSIGGPFTGKGVDKVLIIDDPIKDRGEAESPHKRNRAWDWFTDVARTRVEPGASVIVVATRWHPDDLSGRLIKEGWKYLNLKAIADGEHDPLGRTQGQPLWPEKRPLSFLAEHQRNVYTWASLYQGEPRPRGGSVFNEPTYYTELPSEYRVGYGVDLAYTARTSANYSVCIEGWMTQTRRSGGEIDRKLYIVDVRRAQVDAPNFTLALKGMYSARQGPMLWYGATTERGSADFIKQRVPGFQMRLAAADKFVRAQPAAEAWNSGSVLVPEDDDRNGWVAEFVDEIMSFTGVNDSHDDQVDALAALWDVLAKSGGEIQTPDVDGSRWDSHGSPRGF